VSWGKFEDINGKKIMNLSIEAHHGLVDGIHLAKLIQSLQEALNQS
jgi:chloramphenicol O-acetyltransferase type A